jgi:hypothetical protein
VKTTRREFLATAAATPILSPVLLGMQDKGGTKAPVLGSGAFTYEAIHDWGELPPRIKWGNTHGVVEDSQGNIYVHHTVHATSDSADTMVVFDGKGRFIRSWGSDFKGVAHGLHSRSVHLPAWRVLRPPGQHLRCRMGRGGAGDEAAEGLSRIEIRPLRTHSRAFRSFRPWPARPAAVFGTTRAPRR